MGYNARKFAVVFQYRGQYSKTFRDRGTGMDTHNMRSSCLKKKSPIQFGQNSKDTGHDPAQ
jgi:hypothetical protein